MRKIRFKGKSGTDWAATTVGDPGWAAFWATVDPETVVQGIGLTDTAGAEIFEGDIVRYRTHQGIVRYATGFYEIRWTVRSGDRSTLNHHFEFWNTTTDLTVTGNTQDSPPTTE